MPPGADFDVYVDNGGLVISAINEVSDGKKKTKRDISVEITLDRALSKKIAEACKNLPTLPK
jgi:KaiC/GvpD/RAD55 family RecA-like ATPase